MDQGPFAAPRDSDVPPVACVIVRNAAYRNLTDDRRRAVAALCRTTIQVLDGVAAAGLPIVIRQCEDVQEASTRSAYFAIATALPVEPARQPTLSQGCGVGLLLVPITIVGMAGLGDPDNAFATLALVGGTSISVVLLSVAWAVWRWREWRSTPRAHELVGERRAPPGDPEKEAAEHEAAGRVWEACAVLARAADDETAGTDRWMVLLLAVAAVHERSERLKFAENVLVAIAGRRKDPHVLAAIHRVRAAR